MCNVVGACTGSTDDEQRRVGGDCSQIELLHGIEVSLRGVSDRGLIGFAHINENCPLCEAIEYVGNRYLGRLRHGVILTYPATVRAEEWVPRAEVYRQRVEPLLRDRLERRARGIAHPVEDFLFDYYPYSPGKLATWHPGYGVHLEGQQAEAYVSMAGYRADEDGVTADIAWLGSRRARLNLALNILAGTSSRRPEFHCFGLHEWAMVYGQSPDQVRHPQLPLRVPPSKVTATVDSVGLRCTHIDAYRFFTPEATPRNALVPTRENQPELEQPGCIHAAMDLYKYAFWFSPMVSSEFVLECFENACRARAIDMRASPYDVSEYGLPAIAIETAEGRREYVAAQRAIMETTAPLRRRLAEMLSTLRLALDVDLADHGLPSTHR